MHSTSQLSPGPVCLPTAMQPQIFCNLPWFTPAGEAPLECPITAFYGSRDRRITQDMVDSWRRFTSSTFETIQIEGHHLWPLDKEAKAAWLGHICQRLRRLQEA